jgi:hypothetical protein
LQKNPIALIRCKFSIDEDLKRRGNYHFETITGTRGKPDVHRLRQMACKAARESERADVFGPCGSPTLAFA